MSRMGSVGSVRRGKVLWVAAALMATTALGTGLPSLPAFAQSSSAASPAPATPRAFNIPAQPVANALIQFGQQSGLQATSDVSLVRGIRSAPVTGTMTWQQAITALLAGTGLTYHLNGNMVSVSKLPKGMNADGSMTLPPVQVEGQAQDAQSASGPGVGYVATQSSTATKADTPLITTPQTVAVVTKQQMKDQNSETINEALRYTAGVVPEVHGIGTVLVGTGDEQGTRLRGFTPDIYLDSLYDNYGLVIDPYLLNRIEVLNGPASVLYGQASPGGLIEMQSKLPTDTPLHEVQVGLGSYGEYRGAFDFSGPLDQDGKFLYRLTGVGTTENSQVDFSKTKELAIAPSFTWRPDADTTFTLLGKYQNFPDAGVNDAAIPAKGSVLSNPNGTIPTSFFSGDPNLNKDSASLASIGYQFQHRFDSVWSVSQQFLYQHNHDSRDNVYPSSLSSDDSTLSRYAYYDDTTYDTLSLNTQLLAKFKTYSLSHNLSFGIDYQHITGSSLYGFDFSYPSIDIFAPVYYLAAPAASEITSTSYRGTWNQVGVYAQDQITWRRWHLLLGARGDNANENSASEALSTRKVTTTQYSNVAPTWRAGLVYLFDNGLAPYFSYSTSFQPETGLNYEGVAFKPTTGQQYEVGIKYQPPGWNSFVTASLYNLTEQNVLTVDPLHTEYDTQTGEIRARGVELQGNANLSNNLNLIATYTYTNAVNTTSNTTGTTITGVKESEEGKQPVGVPAQMASLWGKYTFHSGIARGLTLGAGVRYIGSSYGDAVNSFKVPGFTLLDAMLSYDLGEAIPRAEGLKFQINASNLTNKTYVSSCANASACYYGQLRTIFASLTYDW